MASELKQSFDFDRYVNGTLMAEGVTIERASTLDKAMIVAARIATKGPNGETPVLVYRTAPAATDTGLETVEHQYWRDQTQEWLPTGFPDRYRKDGFQVRELVTRSQAEELLAAERAKYRDAMEKLVESQRETLVWQQRAINLKSDNAAKDKQLKEANHV